MFKLFKKYHLAFFITLIINIYFCVTELINFFTSDMRAAISLCGAITYFLAIIFISAIELFKTFKVNAYWAYLFTLIFLVANITIIPIVMLVGGLTKSMDMVYSLSPIFSSFAIVLLLIIYIGYLVLKIIIPLIKSLIARIIKDDYGRCRSFGNVVTHTYTCVIFVMSLFSIMFVMGFADSLPSPRFIFILMIPVYLFLFAVTAIFIFKCVRGMAKASGKSTAIIKK